jgi:hypothetical protein
MRGSPLEALALLVSVEHRTVAHLMPRQTETHQSVDVIAN